MAFEHHHVFAATRRKTTDPVAEQQRRHASPWLPRRRLIDRHWPKRPRRLGQGQIELAFERAPLPQKQGFGDRLQKHPFVRADLFHLEQENPAGLLLPGGPGTAVYQPGELFEKSLAIVFGVIADHHDVGRQPFEAPVFVG